MPELIAKNDLIFDKTHLDQVLRDVVPQLPDGKQWAVGMGVDLNGAAVGFVFEKDGPGPLDFKLETAWRLNRGKHLEGGVSVTISGDD